VLAAVATMGLAAGDSKLGEACINRLDRLAIQLAETVDAIARANGLPTEELAEPIAGKLSLLLHGIPSWQNPVVSPQAIGTPLQDDVGSYTIS
jgi:hypothetical protein